MQTIQEILEQQNLTPQMSLQELGNHFSHIDLTEEEMLEAIIWRKQKKETELKNAALREKMEQNRKRLTQSQFSFEQTRDFMLYRAEQIFEGKKFKVDESNRVIFDLLCRYFSNDVSFISQAQALNVPEPSLDKGIFLTGNLGTGKTWMMKLFCKNNRQVYFIRSAKKIADQFEVEGENAMEEYFSKFKNAVNDSATFFQPFSGLCIDDLGTEDLKMHYGNKKNVLGDIIEKRYMNQTTGPFLHITSNWGREEIEQFYGGRIVSRMREILNFIELPGKDRRK